MLINYFLILIFITEIVLSFFILFKNHKRLVNQALCFFTLSLAGWGSSLLVVKLTENLLFAKLSFVFGSLLIAALLFFAIVFPQKISIKKRYYTIFVLPILFVVISFIDNLLFKGITIVNGSIETERGALYPLFVIFAISYLITSIVIFTIKYKKSFGFERLQFKYLLVGLFSFAILGSITNIILPVLKYNNFNLFGPALSLVFIWFTIYSIIKYRLMNIKLVITRSLLYFFLIIIVTGTFVGGLFLVSKFFTDQGIMGDFGAAVIVSFAVVFLFDPLKKIFAKATDNIFYKDKIDYQEVARDVTQVINREIELKDLAEKVANILKQKMRLREAFLLLSVGKDCFLRPEELTNASSRKRHHKKNKTVYYKSALMIYLAKVKKEVVTDELERMMLDEQSERQQKKLQKVLTDLRALGAAMVVPIFEKEDASDMNAVLVLGRKMSGDVFSSDEFKLLEVFSPQIASSLEKSKLYQEVKSFNVKLQKEVEKATSELKDANLELEEYNEELSNKNKNLGTLQKFAKDILQEVEFDKLAHKLIDALPGEISYCRTALLTLVDDKKKSLHGVTIPQTTKMTDKIYKLVGKDVSKYEVSLKEKDNLLVKAILEGKEQVSNNLADFLSPPLPREAAREIQNIAPKMRSAIAFPLIVSGKPLGVLHFSLTKDIKDVSHENMKMLRVVSDEVALAIERSQFFERLKKLNNQLKVANKNLKELDKAKSEFMSIASHQLRTPLTGVMGYLSMILAGDYGTMKKEQRKVVAEVLDATQRLIRLVNIFLNITRIEAGRFVLNYADIDIKELVEKEVHELLPNAEKKGLKLTYHKPTKKIPTIKVDSDKIKDIVINLVDNAIKYTEKGKIDVYLDKTDGMVELIVKDTGAGIEPEDVKKLFQKFVRAGGGSKVDASGSGLGLYIVKKICEAHGGKVKIKSKGTGKGTAFMVWIPIKPTKK